MKLYMKQKVFSLKDRFLIMDESGNARYYVEGEIFSFGKKLHVYDTAGREVAFIRQKVLSLMPRYYIELGGGVIEIVKELTLLKPSFTFTGLPLSLKGDFWAHEYNLLSENGVIMYLSKKWLTWGDTYELNIANASDELLCLCVALTVDCVLAYEQSSNS